MRIGTIVASLARSAGLAPGRLAALASRVACPPGTGRLRALTGALVLVAAAASGARADTTVSADDVKPSLVLLSTDKASLAVGGLVQLQVAPYVGDDALLDNDDPAARAGFRLRRARLAFDAGFRQLDFLLELNPLESDVETGTISTARLAYAPEPWLRIWAGADKVPFTHGELVSSAELASIERPLVVRELVPQRRLGAAVEGSFADALRVVLGVMNATEGYEKGNQLTGMLGVARVEYHLALGDIGGLAVGAGGFYENGAAANTWAASADLGVTLSGASLLVEALCDDTTPDDMPATSPEVASEVRRCGGYAELGYRLPHPDLQALVRGELVDDNTDVDDAGDVLLVDAGLNYRAYPNLRLQLFYLGRYERNSAERANDAVILGVQGEL